MRQIIVDKGIFQTRIAVLDDGHLKDFQMERATAGSNVGNIYKGRVVDVIPGMDAAFVDIGIGKNAYLSKMDMFRNGKRGRKQDRLDQLIKSGEEILVELIKDASGSKGAKVSMRISLTGKSMVLMPGEDHVGISKQIGSETDRARLQNWINESCLEGHGLIVRTSAKNIPSDQLDVELGMLVEKWRELEKYKVLGASPLCIYSGESFPIDVIRSEFKNNIEKIVCNDDSIFDEIKKYLKINRSEWINLLERYKDQVPIFESYIVNSEFKKLLGRTVELAGGAYLVIDETEALTVVDVNSGQNIGKVGIDQTAHSVNKKAAEMVALLLKIREMSGIILVDFIDVGDPEKKLQLVRYMEKKVSSDRNRVTVHGLTKLGILEMTRKKSVDSLTKRTMQLCGTCDGNRYVPSAESFVDAMIKDMLFHRYHTDAENILYEVSEDVEAFVKDNKSIIKDVLGKIGFAVYLVKGQKQGYKRLRADSEEKLQDFAKKTGYLTLNRI